MSDACLPLVGPLPSACSGLMLLRCVSVPPCARWCWRGCARSSAAGRRCRDLTRDSPRLQALIKQNEAAAAARSSGSRTCSRADEAARAGRGGSEFRVVVAKRQGNPTGLFVGRCPASTGSSPPCTVTRAHAAHSHTHATGRSGLGAAGDGLTRNPNPDPDRSRRSRPDPNPDRSRVAALTLTLTARAGRGDLGADGDEGPRRAANDPNQP